MNNLIENENPILYERCRERKITPEEEDDDITDPFDEREIFGKDFI